MTTPQTFIDCFILYGNTKPEDAARLASTVHYMDEELILWLERRERRAMTRHSVSCPSNCWCTQIGDAMTTLTDEDERWLQEAARIERLKSPLPPEPELARLERQVAERAERKAQADRQERAKRPAPLPPRQPVDFVAEQRRKMEQE
jgi:hypothetical protein